MKKTFIFGSILFSTIVISTISRQTIAEETVWRGSASGWAARFIEEPGYHNEYKGWGGGQVGGFVAIGNYVMHPDFTWSGAATWVTEDGELLFVSYEGGIVIAESEDLPYRFTATMNAEGGTGRLAGASGFALMSGSFDSNLEFVSFQFEGKLDVPGNLQMGGTMQLESLGCGFGEPVSFTMQSFSETSPSSLETANPVRQTGSMIRSSKVVVDTTNPNLTVWSFAVSPGINESLGRPLHLIETERGRLFCEFEAQVRIEIDHNAAGLATKYFDGHFTIVGGTSDYETASGAWQMTFVTNPSFGGPVTATFDMQGELQLNSQKIKSDVVNEIHTHRSDVEEMLLSLRNFRRPGLRSTFQSSLNKARQLTAQEFELPSPNSLSSSSKKTRKNK